MQSSAFLRHASEVATTRNPIELKPAPESAHRLQRRGKYFDLSFLQIHSAKFDARISRFPPEERRAMLRRVGEGLQELHSRDWMHAGNVNRT